MRLNIILASLLLTVGCSNTTEQIAHSLMDKTVMLEIPTLTQNELGEKEVKTFKCAGVFITPTGHILTCAHCVDNGEVHVVGVLSHDGMISPAVILAKDTTRDLALLKINGQNLPYATIADQYSIAVGQDVIAVGYALGLSFTVTKGIISAVHRQMEPRFDVTQSDTAINPGNSGGPLFNLKEELVGINSFMIPPVNAPIFTGLGFSVSPSQIREFLDVFRGLYVAVENN